MADRYTEAQLKTLACIPFVVCPMSLVGSVLVIYMIYLRGERRLYHHLMFMISVIDICTSFVGMFGPIPVPESTGVFLARGNTATCELQGFFYHLSISNMMYNMFLMLSFVKIVRYGAKEEALSTKYERIIHILSLGYPVSTGIAAMVLNLFNPVPNLGMLRCFYAAYPPDCDAEDSTIECTRGENFRDYMAFFAMIPGFVCLILMFGSIFLILATIRRNDKRSRHLSQHSIRNTNRAISVQAMIYGIFFFNTYVWIAVGPVVDILLPNDSEAGSTFRVIVRFISESFFGWQGFFNFLIYMRPRYVRIRSSREDQSRWWAFQEAVFGVKLEDPRYRTTAHSQSYRFGGNTLSGSNRLTGGRSSSGGASKSFVVQQEPNNSTHKDDTTASKLVSQSFQVESGDGGDGGAGDVSSTSSSSPPNSRGPMSTDWDEHLSRSLRIQPDGSVVAGDSNMDLSENDKATIDEEETAGA